MSESFIESLDDKFSNDQIKIAFNLKVYKAE